MAELYKKSEGKWKYVRLNIELQPRLAQALQIQSLPVIALIHKQNLVDTLQTDAKQDLEKFMKVVNKVSGLEDEEGQIVSKLQLVHNYLAQSSNLNECFKILNSVSQTSPPAAPRAPLSIFFCNERASNASIFSLF